MSTDLASEDGEDAYFANIDDSSCQSAKHDGNDMGTAVAFYSADLQAFVALFSSEDEPAFFE